MIRQWIKEIVSAIPSTINWHEGALTGTEKFPLVKFKMYSHQEYIDKCKVCESGIELCYFMPYPDGCTDFTAAVDQSHELLNELKDWHDVIIDALTIFYGVEIKGKKKRVERLQGKSGATNYRYFSKSITECKLIQLRARTTLKYAKGKNKVNVGMLDLKCLTSMLPVIDNTKGFVRNK